MPKRVIAHHQAAVGQLLKQSAQREIRLLGDPRENPIALTRHKIGPAPAHLQRRRTADSALRCDHFTTLRRSPCNVPSRNGGRHPPPSQFARPNKRQSRQSRQASRLRRHWNGNSVVVLKSLPRNERSGKSRRPLFLSMGLVPGLLGPRASVRGPCSLRYWSDTDRPTRSFVENAAVATKSISGPRRCASKFMPAKR